MKRKRLNTLIRLTLSLLLLVGCTDVTEKPDVSNPAASNPDGASGASGVSRGEASGESSAPSAAAEASESAPASAEAPRESSPDAPPPEILYDYMLGLKSFVPADGVYAAEGFAVECADADLKRRCEALSEKGGKAIELRLDAGFAPEGAPAAVLEQAYKIEVGDSVAVTARSGVGLYYGAMTVSRCLKAQGGMRRGVYTDWPDVAERCLHLDIARKYFTKDSIIAIVKSAAAFNINAVQLHFSENEGFRIQCDTDPAVTSDEYLTKDEVREILAAAKERYVEIIPAFDSPGHMFQILAAHPEYRLRDVDGYTSRQTLDITNPEAVRYVKSLLDEYAELFSDCRKFNIGGDECFGWSNIPRMQFSAWKVLENYAKATYGEGANAHDAYIGYVNDIAAYMKAKGFEVRAWNDGLMRTRGQAAVNAPDRELGVMYWSYGGVLNAAPVESYGDGGYGLYNVNEALYYVLKPDYKEPDAADIYANWHSGVFSDGGTSGINLFETPAEAGEALKGACFCIWCDRPDCQTAEEIVENSALALRAAAVKAWNYAPKPSYETFLKQQQIAAECIN